MEQILTFGKHKGKTFSEIEEEDPEYCSWILKQMNSSNRSMEEFQNYLIFNWSEEKVALFKEKEIQKQKQKLVELEMLLEKLEDEDKQLKEEKMKEKVKEEVIEIQEQKNKEINVEMETSPTKTGVATKTAIIMDEFDEFDEFEDDLDGFQLLNEELNEELINEINNFSRFEVKEVKEEQEHVDENEEEARNQQEFEDFADFGDFDFNSEISFLDSQISPPSSPQSQSQLQSQAQGQNGEPTQLQLSFEIIGDFDETQLDETQLQTSLKRNFENDEETQLDETQLQIIPKKKKLYRVLTEFQDSIIPSQVCKIEKEKEIKIKEECEEMEIKIECLPIVEFQKEELMIIKQEIKEEEEEEEEIQRENQVHQEQESMEIKQETIEENQEEFELKNVLEDLIEQNEEQNEENEEKEDEKEEEEGEKEIKEEEQEKEEKKNFSIELEDNLLEDEIEMRKDQQAEEIEKANQLLPSQVTSIYWLFVYNHKFNYGVCQKIGKWLLFFPKGEELDICWKIIKKSTEKGLLGFCSKVSTSKPNPLSSSAQTGVIGVFTEDADDEKKCKVIAKKICSLVHYSRRMYYKSEEQSLENNYSVNGNQRNHLYHYDPR